MTSSLVIRSYVFTAVLDIGLLKKNACSCEGTCIAVAGAKQGPTRGAYPGNLSSMRYARLLKHISTEMKTIVARQRISGPLRVYNLGIFIWVNAMVGRYHTTMAVYL
jgi:hypothetical protein